MSYPPSGYYVADSEEEAYTTSMPLDFMNYEQDDGSGYVTNQPYYSGDHANVTQTGSGFSA
jgi:hypothetical protein